MFATDQPVLVDLSGLTVHGVSFSQNVKQVPARIVRQVSTDPGVYLVELVFSFKGLRRVEVPEGRIRGH
jgi:hypothetical protein